MPSGVGNAVKTNGEPKFFIFTQNDGCPSASAQAQTSAVRSYLATRQHAQRRQHKSTSKENKRTPASKELIHVTRPTRPGDTGQTAPLGSRCQTRFGSLTDLCFEANTAYHSSLPAERPYPEMALDLTFAGISSMLVSFPFELTTEEKYSLHFFLTFGHQKLLNASTKMKYCPISDLAQLLMQVCPIYVLAHIVLGELLLSEHTRTSVRPHYFARSAQMYKAIRSILASKEATFSHKLWAMIQAAMVEHTARRHELQAMHNKALDELFEFRGGVIATVDAPVDDIYLQISSRLYASPLARVAVMSPAFRQFEFDNIKDRFVSALDGIRDQLIFLHDEFTDQDVILKISPPQLDRLKIYLDLLSPTCCHRSSSGGDYEYELGALFCLLSIARTFVDCQGSREATLSFLSSVQDCLDGSTYSAVCGTNTLHPSATTYGISCVRSRVFPKHSPQTEFKISQTLVDAQRLFPLTSPAARRDIIAWLVACISTTACLAGDGGKFEDEIEKVKSFETQMFVDELELSWHMKAFQEPV